MKTHHNNHVLGRKRRALFITFNLFRPGDSKPTLSIGSIFGHLKNDPLLAETLQLHHIPVNMFDYGANATEEDFRMWLSGHDLKSFDDIAISAYVWNEYLINPLISYLRKQGFRGFILLGGYQIGYAERESLAQLYPEADVFIPGYAEESLLEWFKGMHTGPFPLILDRKMSYEDIPSPYLTGILDVPHGTQMVRLETKRGCPYRCHFCAHRDLTRNKLYKRPLDKVFDEISFLTDRHVKRVNILDPVFNVGKEYLSVMEHINKVKNGTVFTLQSRFEKLDEDEGERFLELAADGRYLLEFGLQTIHTTEMEAINRKNDMTKVRHAFSRLSTSGVQFEVSLIYGLPGQTVDSFRQSIDFAQSNGAEVIKAYPLMLLRGTEMYSNKHQWGLKEESTGEFGIPVVTESNTFRRHEWEVMKQIADGLEKTGRI
jgi:radical SAM superfamily enzyme YgiQ (UPF0313 family)